MSADAHWQSSCLPSNQNTAHGRDDDGQTWFAGGCGDTAAAFSTGFGHDRWGG